MSHVSLDSLESFIEDKRQATPASRQPNDTRRRYLNRELTPNQARARLSNSLSNDEAEVLVFLAKIMHGDEHRIVFEKFCICTRKGQAALDYSGVAEMCRTVLGIDISQTAVKNVVNLIRKKYREYEHDMNTNQEKLIDRVKYNQSRLQQIHERVQHLSQEQWEHAAVEILNLVRLSVAHILPAEYGEGIRDVDLDESEKRLLEFAKLTPNLPANPDVGSLRQDVASCLQALDNYDPDSTSSDFRLIESGVRLILDLVGLDHICGLFARLNIVTVIRDELSPEDYILEMEQIGAAARRLHGDKETDRLRRWITNNLDSEDQIPTALRLSSYCSGNLVFRSLDAILQGYLDNLEQVEKAIQQVKNQDSGFEQIAWWELATAAVICERTGSNEKLRVAVGKVGKKLTKVLSDIEQSTDYDSVKDVLHKYVLQIVNAND